jgi:hypothetical protein
MDLNAVAAIAEVVAAVGVVVSLVYLAVQVRGNSELLERTVQANRTSNSQSVIQNYNDWRAVLLEGDNVDIWHRGINDLTALSSAERLRFNFLASSFVWCGWFMYQLQRNEGLMADLNARVWQDFFKHPGFREWMTDHLQFHSDDFGDSLEEVRVAVGADVFKPGEPSSLIPGQH